MLYPLSDDPPLPWEQHEYPGKPTLSDLVLHRRRENVLLSLAGLFLIASVMLPMVGLARILDLSIAIPALHFELAVLVPAGALALPVAFLAMGLLCELFGRRQAMSIALVSALLNIAALIFAAIAGGLPATVGDTANAANAAAIGEPFLRGLTLVAFHLITLVVNIQVYSWVRRWTSGRARRLRFVLATPLGLVAGAATLAPWWNEFGRALAVDPNLASQVMLAVPYALIGLALGAIPFRLTTEVLASFLRIRLDYGHVSQPAIAFAVTEQHPVQVMPALPGVHHQ